MSEIGIWERKTRGQVNHTHPSNQTSIQYDTLLMKACVEGMLNLRDFESSWIGSEEWVVHVGHTSGANTDRAFIWGCTSIRYVG